MVAGIPPREASDRLGIFQARFDELWRKYETYSGKHVYLPYDFPGSDHLRNLFNFNRSAETFLN